MSEPFGKHLTPRQYTAIRRYWRIIERLRYRLEHFDCSQFVSWEEYSDDEEAIIEYKTNNERVERRLERLIWKIDHYEKEYTKYVNKIGFELNDRSQDEYLFNLLNNGIELNV